LSNTETLAVQIEVDVYSFVWINHFVSLSYALSIPYISADCNP
jgi:hypothetical protein